MTRWPSAPERINFLGAVGKSHSERVYVRVIGAPANLTLHRAPHKRGWLLTACLSSSPAAAAALAIEDLCVASHSRLRISREDNRLPSDRLACMRPARQSSWISTFSSHFGARVMNSTTAVRLRKARTSAFAGVLRTVRLGGRGDSRDSSRTIPATDSSRLPGEFSGLGRRERGCRNSSEGAARSVSAAAPSHTREACVVSCLPRFVGRDSGSCRVPRRRGEGRTWGGTESGIGAGGLRRDLVLRTPAQ